MAKYEESCKNRETGKCEESENVNLLKMEFLRLSRFRDVTHCTAQLEDSVVRNFYNNLCLSDIGPFLFYFRVAVVDKVTDFILFIGKLVVVGAMSK